VVPELADTTASVVIEGIDPALQFTPVAQFPLFAPM
jgi:hypothetical protein